MASLRDAPVDYASTLRHHGGPRGSDCARRGKRAHIGSSSTPPLLHRRGPRHGRKRLDRGAVSGPRRRPWRPVHLFTVRARGSAMSCSILSAGYRDISRLRRHNRGMDHPHTSHLRCAGRARQATAWALWVRRPEKGQKDRRQDHSHRYPPPALGDAARLRAKCRARFVAFFRHRSVRGFCQKAPRRPPGLADLGRPTSTAQLDSVLRAEFERLFGTAADAQRVSRRRYSSPRHRTYSSSSVPWPRWGILHDAGTGPKSRQSSIMVRTTSSKPANSASTEPSRQLRTQPSTQPVPAPSERSRHESRRRAPGRG